MLSNDREYMSDGNACWPSTERPERITIHHSVEPALSLSKAVSHNAWDEKDYGADESTAAMDQDSQETNEARRGFTMILCSVWTAYCCKAERTKACFLWIGCMCRTLSENGYGVQTVSSVVLYMQVRLTVYVVIWALLIYLFYRSGFNYYG